MSGESVRTLRRSGEHKLCEGWLEHKTNNQNSGQKWQELWIVLKSNIIYVFLSDETNQDNQIGNLTVDQDTTFINTDGGDTRKGYKFDLKTGKRLNRFKTKSSSQREEWRAYILGMATGQVPSDIDLLPREKARMQADIDAVLRGAPPNRQSTYSGGSLESGIVSDITSGISGVNFPYQGSPSGSTGSSSANTQLDMGGPVMVHRFHPDRFDQRVPSWFFQRCPRHTAETILLNIQAYGNTLMRESSTHKDNGSYVISKSFFNSSSDRMEIEHYEVMRVATGYRINVENKQPEMTNLTAVMDYFVSTTGGSAQLMTTNDLRTLGMDEPDYETRRIRGIPETPPEPWAWPPPDYDDSHSARPTYRPSDAKTVTPGILKNKYGSTNAGSPGSRWSGGSVQQPPKTIANFSRPHSVNPGLAEIQHRVHQTDTLRALDDAIDGGFDRTSVYMNVGQDSSPPPPLPHKPAPHSYVNEEDDQPVAQVPIPPPPPPHQPTPQSYINQPSKDHDDVTLRALPEAPPPPTYRKNRNSVTSPTSPPPPPAPATPSKTQKGQYSSNSNQRVTSPPGQFVPPNLNSTNERANRNTPKSPGSPASFPTWTDPKPVTKIVVSAPKVDTPNAINNENGTPEITGVDDTDPGGVSDIRSRFEKSTPAKSPPSVSQKPAGGGATGRARPKSSMLPSTAPAPSLSTSRRSSSPTMRTNSRPLSYTTNTNSRSFSTSSSSSSSAHSSARNTNDRERNANGRERNTNATNPSSVRVATNQSVREATNTTNTDKQTVPFFYTNTDDDFLYDDTAIPRSEDLRIVEKKVAFQQNDQSESVPPSARRKTEPAISVSKSQFQALFSGFDDDIDLPPPPLAQCNTLPARPRTLHASKTPPRLPVRTGSLHSTTSRPAKYIHKSNSLPTTTTHEMHKQATSREMACDQRNRPSPAAPSISTGSTSIPIPPPPPPPPPPPQPWQQTGQSPTWKTAPVVTFPRKISTPSNNLTEDLGRQIALQRGRRQTEPAVLLRPQPEREPEDYKGTSDKFKQLLESKLGGAVQNSSKPAESRKFNEDENPYDVIDDIRRSRNVVRFENSTNL